MSWTTFTRVIAGFVLRLVGRRAWLRLVVLLLVAMILLFLGLALIAKLP